MTRALIALLRGYKKYISPHLGHHCRFLPTCSEYAMQALAVHGLGKGLLLTAWRLLRCNPFGKFGYDPVPPKGRWVSDERRLTREKMKNEKLWCRALRDGLKKPAVDVHHAATFLVRVRGTGCL